MVMKQYDSYKPSGVEWIGHIPSHWEVRRLKHVVSCNDEVLSEMTPPWSVINYVEISDVTYINGIKGSTEYEFKDAPSRARRITRVNDVIISTVRTYLKAVARVNVPDIIVSTGFAVLRAQSIDDLYLSYVVKSSGFIDDVVANSVGVTYPSITASKLMSLSLPLPHLEEQERIAEYLDRRCAEIDGIINKEEQAIALLDELKQSIISEAVTRGLDPDAPLKPSGVDWIGNIPSHWQVWKVSHMFDNIGSGTTPSSSNKEYYTGSEGYHWLQTGDLNDGIIRSTSKMVTQKAIDDYKLKFYPENSLVIAMYGATIGKIGLLDIDTATNQACCVLPSSKVCLPIYAFYQFTAAKRYLLMEAVGGGQPNISQDIIKRTMVPLPPLEEQERIAEYLDKRCAEIDEAKERKQRQIELLREMKQTLISDAVTGRVKVF